MAIRHGGGGGMGEEGRIPERLEASQLFTRQGYNQLSIASLKVYKGT